jgi:hypothetical protein
MLLVAAVLAIVAMTVAQLWCLWPGNRRETVVRMLAALIGVAVVFRLLLLVALGEVDETVGFIATGISIAAALTGIGFAAFLRLFRKLTGRVRTVVLVIINTIIVVAIGGVGTMLMYGRAVG